MNFLPAVREHTSLIILVAGPSGSGKTLSSLLLARGLAGGDDSKIGVIDTENGRARHYAPTRGERPSAHKFGFMHADLSAPYTPEAYVEAIEAAEAAGFAVIVIDSASHEWDGEGGLKDIHRELVEADVERQRAQAESKGWSSFNEAMAAEKASISAWKIPKDVRHKKLVQRLLKCRAHLVLSLRADEKMRMDTIVENGRKRTVITAAKDLPPQDRWVPNCEKRLPYEATVSFLLTPDRPGVPIPLKLQEQHKFAFPDGQQIGEAAGRALAAWALGGPDPAMEAAREGSDAFRAYWGKLTKAERESLKHRLEDFQRIAKEADATHTDTMSSRRAGDGSGAVEDAGAGASSSQAS